jgi:methane/ammonia monooxygenase subunit B
MSLHNNLLQIKVVPVVLFVLIAASISQIAFAQIANMTNSTSPALNATSPALNATSPALNATSPALNATTSTVRILNESISAQMINTGDTLALAGTIQSLANIPLNASFSFSDPNASKIWELLAKDPPGNFTIHAQQTVPYSITVRALEPGIYNVQTQVNIEQGGIGLGPEHTIKVTGPG